MGIEDSRCLQYNCASPNWAWQSGNFTKSLVKWLKEKCIYKRFLIRQKRVNGIWSCSPYILIKSH